VPIRLLGREKVLRIPAMVIKEKTGSLKRILQNFFCIIYNKIDISKNQMEVLHANIGINYAKKGL
jgi:hypothetical protein